MAITYKLKYWRTRRAISIEDLAEKSGCSTRTIVDIEKYGKMPRFTTIRKLASALDVTIDELQEITPDESESGNKENQNQGNKFALAG
jgi:transcriptional regulator with XRE-family HTH domain